MASKPAAPSGLTVERSRNNYTITWKRTKKYNAQTFYYVINEGEQNLISVKNTDTTKTVSIPKSNFYPKTDLKVSDLSFYIKGKYGKKWSDPARKQYPLVTPPKPTMTTTLSTDYENTTTFDFGIDWAKLAESMETDSYSISKEVTTAIFTNFQWWTSLLPNSELESDDITDWQETGTTDDDVDTTYKTITETEPFTGNYSYTRYLKVVARGPAGDSKPVYGKHVYAFPNPARNVKASATPLESGNGYRVSVQWTADETKARPIDSIVIQYAIATPNSSYRTEDGICKTEISIPNIEESSWQTAATLKDTTDTNGDVDGTAFVVSPNLHDDNCIFVRVATKHDNKLSYSDVVFVEDSYAALAAPSGLSANVNGDIATISVTNNSTLSASFVGIYYRSDIDPSPRLIGIHSASRPQSISVKLPSTEEASVISFGVRTFLADYTPVGQQVDSTIYAISNIKMQSKGIIWDERAVPKPPSNIGLSSPRFGIVRITWDWTWTAANGVELSWADHDDAWESTDGPQTYVLENTRASAWNIAGLDVGTWYFRIRLFKVDDDATTYGTYSDIHSIKLASSPATPVLTLSPSIVQPDGKVTCYWAFTATDGDEQVQADICEATLDNSGTATFGNVIAKANNEQYKTLNISDLGWAAGSKHYLSVKIVTASGEESDNWSIPKPIQVLEPITCSITSTSLESSVEEGLNKLYLTEMPLTVSATGAGESGIMTYILERAADYHIDRPDENESGGFAGETVAIIQKSSDNDSGESANYDVVINQSDLFGPLDDGARYNLVAIAQDSYGQTSTTGVSFEVRWSHQAVMPSALIQIDNEEMVAFITPIQPDGYQAGDVCDIYRLSPDRPELILQNADFGTKYVDLYPSLGKSGGHRIVYKTSNGDYITEDNEFAWVDYREEDGDIVDVFATVIDFGYDQVVLPYDLSLSSSWAKDFTKTKYLGGSIQGDWNYGVERTGTVKGRVAVQQDSDLIFSIRALANYSGVCHVRTPDGSSFAANVDVTEDREEKKINMISSFTFTITKIDSPRLDGMTYADWNKES